MSAPTRSSRSLIVAVLATGLLTCLFTACAAPAPTAPGDAEGTGSSEATATETVERRSFDTVLSLPATVVAGVPFQVTAPASGTLVDIDGRLAVRLDSGREAAIGGGARIERSLVDPGTDVVVGLPVAEAVHEGFALRASLTAADLLRLSPSRESGSAAKPTTAEGEVLGSSGPFACDLVDPFPSSVDPAVIQEGDSYLACAIPASVRVIAGMTGRVVLTLDTHEEVLSLPLEAVAGTVDRARVSLRTGDGIVDREVTLGGSNGYLVEIVDGLREGDEVLLPAPSLLE